MVTSSLPGSKKREHRSGCSRLFSSHEKSPDEFLTAAALHRSQRFAHLGEALLYRRAGLDVGPPCREFRMSVERLDPEEGHQVGHEEHRRRERTIGEREVGAAREAAIGDHLFELVHAVFEVGQLFADELFVAGLRVHLVEQRTQRRLEVEVVESGQDSHFGAASGLLGSSGGVGYLSSRYSLMTSDSGMSRPSASSAGVLPSGLTFAYSEIGRAS